jgi:hypothetical protein
MKRTRHLVAALLAIAAAAGAQAQHVKGNEAIVQGPSGKKVERPQMPGKGVKGQPCKADGGCHPGPWYMVETDDGLRECTEPYARAGACRTSTYGSQKLYRLWVVKSKGTWLQCQLPDTSSKCVDMFARPPHNLPFPAVQ